MSPVTVQHRRAAWPPQEIHVATGSQHRQAASVRLRRSWRIRKERFRVLDRRRPDSAVTRTGMEGGSVAARTSGQCRSALGVASGMEPEIAPQVSIVKRKSGSGTGAGLQPCRRHVLAASRSSASSFSDAPRIRSKASYGITSAWEQLDRAVVWYNHRSLWRRRAATPWSSLPLTGTKAPL